MEKIYTKTKTKKTPTQSRSEYSRFHKTKTSSIYRTPETSTVWLVVVQSNKLARERFNLKSRFICYDDMPLGVIWEIEKIKHHIEQIVVVVRKFIEPDPEMSDWAELSWVKWNEPNRMVEEFSYFYTCRWLVWEETWLCWAVCLGLVDLSFFVLIWISIELILISCWSASGWNLLNKFYYRNLYFLILSRKLLLILC